MSQDQFDVEYYDDGLVHSHDWANSTPPGGHHAARRAAAERDAAKSREAA